MKQRFRWLALALLLLPLPALALTVTGSSTIQPLLEAVADEYSEATGDTLDVEGGGSSRGIADAIAGESDVGSAARALTNAEVAELEYTTIGLDTLAFIVNEANPLRNITRRQLNGLYTGKRDWSDLVDGFDWSVRLVSKEVGRSTLDLFENYSGLTSPDRRGASGQRISDEATVIGSNLESLTLVGGQRGGMGYVSLGAAGSMQADGMPIRILDLGGVTPSGRTIQSGDYPIRRELNLVYQEMTPAIEALLEVLATSRGQKVIEDAGFIATGGQ